MGLQCPRYLWNAFNDPSQIPELTEAEKHKMEEGNAIGQLAKELFPDGIDIPEDNFKNNLKKTQELLPKRKPLFEAAITFNMLYSRADILVPIGKNQWDVIEVKSGTRVKNINLHDVSFQKYCYEKAGLKIRKCFLMHTNKEYIKKGKIDPKKLLVKEDVTKQVNELINNVEENIEYMSQIVSSKMPPELSYKRLCSEGSHNCKKDGCLKDLPKDSVFHLYNGGRKSYDLNELGIRSLKKIPSTFKLTGKQQIQKSCALNNKIYVNKETLKHFLKTLNYPLYYLDFETMDFAIPKVDKSRPWQKIPFQFSLHIVNGGGSKSEHFSFLADGSEDPRPKFLYELKNVLGDYGGVVVYNQTFEKMILSQLATDFPEYKEWINSVLGRIVDLVVPFRNFSYYNPSQEGSASIKKVLPALTGKGYEGMDISDGGAASMSFIEISYNEVSEAKKKKIREDLLKYCGLDTEAMVWIVDELKRLKNEKDQT